MSRHTVLSIPEDTIHRNCIELLDLLQVVYFHVPNENLGNKAWRARLKAYGLTPGVADLVLLFDEGVVVFVEIKTAEGELSKQQRNWRDMVEGLGFHYHVVRSTDALQKVVALYR
jgi:hypothetical protein